MLHRFLQPFPDMFDPAGFATNAKVRDIRRWRESELVHGRVAMLAALGFIVGEQLEDIPAFREHREATPPARTETVIAATDRLCGPQLVLFCAHLICRCDAPHLHTLSS